MSFERCGSIRRAFTEQWRAVKPRSSRLIVPLVLFLAACASDPMDDTNQSSSGDATFSYEEWVEFFYAEEGLRCEGRALCPMSVPCDDITQQYLNDSSCEFYPERIVIYLRDAPKYIEEGECDDSRWFSIEDACIDVVLCGDAA